MAVTRPLNVNEAVDRLIEIGLTRYTVDTGRGTLIGNVLAGQLAGPEILELCDYLLQANNCHLMAGALNALTPGKPGLFTHSGTHLHIKLPMWWEDGWHGNSISEIKEGTRQ